MHVYFTDLLKAVCMCPLNSLYLIKTFCFNTKEHIKLNFPFLILVMFNVCGNVLPFSYAMSQTIRIQELLMCHIALCLNFLNDNGVSVNSSYHGC